MNTLFLLIFSCFIALTTSDKLRCFDCDPKTEGKCINPETDNVPITVCEDNKKGSSSGLKKEINDIDRLDIEPRININELTYECFSLYFETIEIKTTGVYRGCTERSTSVQSSCEYLAERLPDGNITTCESCAVEKCNTQYVGGALSLISSLAFIGFNLVVVLVLAL